MRSIRGHAIAAATACGILATVAATAGQQPRGVRVSAVEDRIYGRVAYRYAVENNSGTRSIVSFRIGEDDRRSRAELRQPPYGWTDEKGLPIGSAFAPDGWTVEAVREDEAQLWFVEWFTSEADDTLDIAPGEVRDGFSLIVFDSAPEYLTSHWTVVFDDGVRLSGRVEADTR
ncbi:MAG: hypothetical protein ACRD26_01190 [Vicinamibacterales bacterium]